MLDRSILHLFIDEGKGYLKPGFRKRYFASSERSAGSNALRKCEVPTKWAKYLVSKDINSHLDHMFKDATDLRIHGDSSG